VADVLSSAAASRPVDPVKVRAQAAAVAAAAARAAAGAAGSIPGAAGTSSAHDAADMGSWASMPLLDRSALQEERLQAASERLAARSRRTP
jgi:hypothetical protein